MKISLNMGQSDLSSGRDAGRSLERLILAAKDGDWNAKNALAGKFMPLLSSLAEKRAKQAGETPKYIEAGKQGLQRAARKYRKGMPPEKFQVFALDFIEDAMDHAQKKGGEGLLTRLFGR